MGNQRIKEARMGPIHRRFRVDIGLSLDKLVHHRRVTVKGRDEEGGPPFLLEKLSNHLRVP